MATETHLNALIQDVEKAYKDALGAVDDLKLKMDALKSRLLTEAGQEVNTIEQSVKGRSGRPKQQE